MPESRVLCAGDESRESQVRHFGDAGLRENAMHR
jgi:hypothetical protein